MKMKHTAKVKKPKANVRDLKPKKNPKAGASPQLGAGKHLASVTDLVIDPFNPNR